MIEHYADKILLEGPNYVDVMEQETGQQMPYWFKNDLIRSHKMIEQTSITDLEAIKRMRKVLKRTLEKILKDNI